MNDKKSVSSAHKGAPRKEKKNGREYWRPGNMLYPLPAVLVSCADRKGRKNVLTVAWTGTVCSDPAMVYISVCPGRYSHDIIKDTGEFVINLTTAELSKAADYCGVKSGRDTDKFAECGLTAIPSKHVKAPSIAESPVSIECRLASITPLGSHDMMIGEVLGVSVDEKYVDRSGRLMLEKTRPLVYCHGGYFGLGSYIGHFGFSVRKKKKSGRNPGIRRR